MKKFETPEMEVVKFEAVDVITTSGDPVSPPGGIITPDDEV